MYVIYGREDLVVLSYLSLLEAERLKEPISQVCSWINGLVKIAVVRLHSLVMWALGVERGNAKGPGGVPPPVGQADHVDYSNTWGGRGVVTSPGGGGTGSRGTTLHNGLN